MKRIKWISLILAGLIIMFTGCSGDSAIHSGSVNTEQTDQQTLSSNATQGNGGSGEKANNKELEALKDAGKIDFKDHETEAIDLLENCVNSDYGFNYKTSDPLEVTFMNILDDGGCEFSDTELDFVEDYYNLSPCKGVFYEDSTVTKFVPDPLNKLGPQYYVYDADKIDWIAENIYNVKNKHDSGEMKEYGSGALYFYQNAYYVAVELANTVDLYDVKITDYKKDSDGIYKITFDYTDNFEESQTGSATLKAKKSQDGKFYWTFLEYDPGDTGYAIDGTDNGSSEKNTESLKPPTIGKWTNDASDFDAAGLNVSWSKVDGAQKYEYRFFFEANGINTPMESGETEKTNASCFFQDIGDSIRVQVRAKADKNGQTVYSEWVTGEVSAAEIDRITADTGDATNTSNASNTSANETEDEIKARLVKWAKAYIEQFGTSPQYYDCEANGDGTYTIHVYDIVEHEDEGHTATTNWLYVDANGKGTDLLGEDVDIHP